MKRSRRTSTPEPVATAVVPLRTLRGPLVAGGRRWDAFDGLRSTVVIETQGNTISRSSMDGRPITRKRQAP